MFFFFFSSRRRHTRWPRDWSSDVCSSDLNVRPTAHAACTRWAMADSPLGPAPTRRYVADCFPSRSTSIVSGMPAPSANAIQAFTAGCQPSLPQRIVRALFAVSVRTIRVTRPPLIVQHQWGRLERSGNLAPLLGRESGPSTLERPRGVVPRHGCPHGGVERLRKQPVPRVERVGDRL